MERIPTYGMAGIGIAAAVGFIFALSMFSNLGKSFNAGNGNLETLQQKGSESPASSQSVDSNGATSTFAKGTERSTQPQGNLGLSQDRASLGVHPSLISVIVLSENREKISELVPQMQFQSGKPVFIQAKFVNYDQNQILNYTITMSVNSKDQAPGNQQAAKFHGDIKENSGLELELYWDPGMVGEYIVLVSSNTATSPQIEKPLVAVPVNVVAAP